MGREQDIKMLIQRYNEIWDKEKIIDKNRKKRNEYQRNYYNKWIKKSGVKFYKTKGVKHESYSLISNFKFR